MPVLVIVHLFTVCGAPCLRCFVDSFGKKLCWRLPSEATSRGRLEITTCVLGCVSPGHKRAMSRRRETFAHSPRVLDMTGRAELRTRMDTQQPMICAQGGKKKLQTSQKKEGNAEKEHLFILPPTTHTGHHACAPPPPPLLVKLVPRIVRLVGLKLLITASRPPLSFQALFFTGGVMAA